MALDLTKLNPAKVIVELDRVDCAESLASFIKLAWHVIEPGQPYIHNWHVDFICEHLEAITEGHVLEDGTPYNRLLINIPPGFSKSVILNIMWPAWEWGPKNMPHQRYLCVAHNQKLSARDSRKMRQLVTSKWYQDRWGDRVKLTKDQNEKINFVNTATGFREAMASGSVTGSRGTRVICDDPHSVESAASDAMREATIDWFLEAVPTRLNDPIWSAIVVIMQRLHEQDVSGIIIDKKLGYDHIMLPMRYDPERAFPTKLGLIDPREEPGELLFPERFPIEVVERDEKVMSSVGGDYAISGQFQQLPVPRGGGVIKQAWWKLWDAPEYPALDYVVAYLDTAYTSKTQNDPSAMTIWGVFSGASVSSGATRSTARDGTQLELTPRAQDNDHPRVMLLHAWDERLEFHDLLRRVQKDVKSWHVDTLLIEDKAAGHSIAQELRRVFGNDGYTIRMDNPGTMDKVGRMYAVAHLFEEGLIWAPDKEWADKVIKQCEFVGRSARDDLADTTSGSLRFLRQTGMLVRGQEFAARQEDDMRYTGGPPEPLYPG